MLQECRHTLEAENLLSSLRFSHPRRPAQPLPSGCCYFPRFLPAEPFAWAPVLLVATVAFCIPCHVTRTLPLLSLGWSPAAKEFLQHTFLLSYTCYKYIKYWSFNQRGNALISEILVVLSITNPCDNDHKAWPRVWKAGKVNIETGKQIFHNIYSWI